MLQHVPEVVCATGVFEVVTLFMSWRSVKTAACLELQSGIVLLQHCTAMDAYSCGTDKEGGAWLLWNW